MVVQKNEMINIILKYRLEKISFEEPHHYRETFYVNNKKIRRKRESFVEYSEKR